MLSIHRILKIVSKSKRTKLYLGNTLDYLEIELSNTLKTNIILLKEYSVRKFRIQSFHSA